ncbi:MAG: hypothetical protein MR209_00205 [Veillonellaceae bacterium]|nr:hypothetical protein [Veillonellaceae bacterium]
MRFHICKVTVALRSQSEPLTLNNVESIRYFSEKELSADDTDDQATPHRKIFASTESFVYWANTTQLDFYCADNSVLSVLTQDILSIKLEF